MNLETFQGLLPDYVLDQLDEQEAQEQQLQLPLHDNIRGADYYQ